MSYPHRAIWERANSLPTPCFWCGDEVVKWGLLSFDGVIHHLDEDRSNNELSNLAVGHRACHLRHHSLGRVFTAEHREKLSAALLGHQVSDASRAKMSASSKGRPLSSDHRAKLGDGRLSEKKPCPTCGVEYNPCWMGRHVKAGKCRQD